MITLTSIREQRLNAETTRDDSWRVVAGLLKTLGDEGRNAAVAYESATRELAILNKLEGELIANGKPSTEGA